MSFSSETAKQVRDLFEGREAIYIEKGAVHVQVSGIRWRPVLTGIEADVEEIPTSGFPWRHREGSGPQRWTIGAGYLTMFSQHMWQMGYGGWTLYFAPEAVKGVLNVVSQFPKDLSFEQRYKMILDYLRSLRTLSRSLSVPESH